jgi:hypothetical protein
MFYYQKRKLWKNCNKYYVRSFSGWQVCGYGVVKLYFLQGFQNLVGIFYLISKRSKKNFAGNVKVIMKNKKFYYRPDRNGIFLLLPEALEGNN